MVILLISLAIFIFFVIYMAVFSETLDITEWYWRIKLGSISMNNSIDTGLDNAIYKLINIKTIVKTETDYGDKILYFSDGTAINTMLGEIVVLSITKKL